MSKRVRNFSAAPTLFGGFTLPKIRTYRIPYVGSKNAIASQVIEGILSSTVDHGSRRFVDAFCGGGAILYGILQTKMFAAILGNDLHSEMVELHKNLCDLDLQYIAETPCILLPNATVQERYPHVKLIDEIEPRYQMAFKIVYSFGNHCRTNMWGDKMVIKYELARLLMFEPDTIGAAISAFIGADLVIPYPYVAIGFGARYSEYKTHLSLYRKRLGEMPRADLEQLQQLQQLERLEQLEQLQISNLSYEQVKITTPKHETVIYLDPPYKSTAKYQNELNHDDLLAWIKGSQYKIYLSSYEFDGLYECHSMKHRCTLSATANNRVEEKLFCNRDDEIKNYQPELF